MSTVKNRYAFPYWRMVLFNLLRQKHKGYIDVGYLFKAQMNDAEGKYETFFTLVEKIIDGEPGETEKEKRKAFYDKTTLNDKFLRDLRDKADHTPKMYTVMAIIMGHTCDEVSDELAGALIASAGTSVENAKPLNQLYALLLNIRDDKKFEDMVREQHGDNVNEKRILAANQILNDAYYKIPRIQMLFSHRKKDGKETRIPRELVLGIL